MADERREPEDGQRLPARRVEDGRRHRPPGRGPPQGRDALAVRRPGGDRRGYRKGHTYPTVVRRTDPKGQLYLFCFNVCSTGSAVFFRSVG